MLTLNEFSDFTRLAARIREEGVPVYGFGERKTPKAFVSACDKFIYTEVFSTKEQKERPSQIPIANVLKGNAKLVSLLRRSIEEASDESGWARLSTVGTNIAKQAPDFDPKNYGCVKLGELVAAIELFDIHKRDSGGTGSKIMYIRDQGKKVRSEPKQSDSASVCTAQWEQFVQRYAEGDTCKGTIESIAWMGLFITLADSGATGLLHKSNLPEDFMTYFTVGQKISVTIKVIRAEKHQIELQRAS